MQINVNSEWDVLKSIIVGVADNANFPINNQTQLIMSKGWTKTSPPVGSVSQSIIDEANEDLQILSDTLQSLGIEVLRPEPLDFQKTNGQYAYCPRDNLLVLGDMVIETPMANKCRQQEMDCYRYIRKAAIKNNIKWISAPVPDMFDEENIIDDEFVLNENEPVFDAANICKLGHGRLLYLISNSGNKLGAQWLKNLLGRQWKVETTSVYKAAHIDSTIVPVDYRTAVLNANRVNEYNLPSAMREWKKIYITEDMINPQTFIGYPYASKWIAINMLPLGNKRVICDKHQPKIIKELERHQLEVIPLEMRHARTLGGGFHCVTLDLWRQ